MFCDTCNILACLPKYPFQLTFAALGLTPVKTTGYDVEARMVFWPQACLVTSVRKKSFGLQGERP
jgi:hypothetical protein